MFFSDGKVHQVVLKDKSHVYTVLVKRTYISSKEMAFPSILVWYTNAPSWT